MNDSSMDLQCLAAKCVGIWLIHEWADGEIPVIDVWKNDANKYNTCSDHDWFLWQLNEMEVPRFTNINLPNKIRFLIEDNMAPIIDQVLIWIQYHHERNFFHDQPSSSLSEYIVKLVWNHHFQIDYTATAAKILTNENLSPLERFRFASMYCIVEEMKKFRDLMAAESVPEWDFSEDPFLVYWSKYLKNELDTCSLPGVTDKFPLDELMFIKTLEKFDSWPAVVYFFDKLDSASKSSKFEDIVEWCGERYLKDLLAKLTDKKWKLASRSAVLKLMVEKIVEYGTLDDVRLIWQLFGSEMDSKDFCVILETLVPLSMRNESNFEKWTPLLMEIWTGASGELKQSAIDMKLWPSIGEKFISRIPLVYSKEFHALRQISDPMKFIRLTLISMESDAKKRKEFFAQNFHWLIIWAPFTEVEKLMQDFLEQFDYDVVELKNEIANSSDIDRSLLRFILFVDFDQLDELDAALSFLRNSRRILELLNDDDINFRGCFITLIWNLLGPKTDPNVFYGPMFFYLYFAIWKILFRYAKMAISEARIAPDSFVNDLIELGWFREICYWRTEPIATRMGILQQMERYLFKLLDYSNEPDFELLKKKFKVYLFTSLFDTKCPVERVFNRVNVQNFLLWIYNGDEQLIDDDFKQSGQFADGFLVQLKFCVNEECFQATRSMEEFLEWCFETEAERREFKMGMIYKFREYKLIEDLLTRRKYRRAILFWFFDGDVSAIEKFAVEYSRNPIHTVNAAEADSDPEADDSQE
ncbi:uncharacterized protein LOC135837506 [Planococcus citri]|uniref:uncharacterized protein LOC135837506 n=1 Tax=Planococcus citri TaxID=170843 RepID=UPI0031F85932